MRARLAIVAALVGALWLTDHGEGYVLLGRRWPSTIVMHLQLGSAAGGLIDGSSNWNTVAEGALATWNQNLSNAPFRIENNSTVGVSLRNGSNNVVWADDVYGDS